MRSATLYQPKCLLVKNLDIYILYLCWVYFTPFYMDLFSFYWDYVFLGKRKVTIEG